MGKYVYSFNEGDKTMKDLLGGKGANLAEMTKIGLPVPFGFTITTEACNRYYDENRTLAGDVVEAVYEKIEELENVTGKKFGSDENPLLVSVRSGAVISMPGMMDTILNLFINGLHNVVSHSTIFFVVPVACLCGDCKTKRHRKTDFGHFRKICSFSPEKVLHPLVTFIKGVYIFFHKNLHFCHF